MDRLLADAHALARDWWDPSHRLLTHPGGLLGAAVIDRGVRPLPQATAWWAYGLLRRAAPGDRELAEVALRRVCELQVTATGLPSTDPAGDLPIETAVACALALRDHRLPAPLRTAVRETVEQVVDAAAGRDLAVTRTTSAVLRAWLELEVGRLRSDEELLRVGAARARAVAADAGVRGHVAEHAGPSVTGGTLLGLSLWAERPPVEDLAPLGRALRDEVWHDLLAIWHPGLRTLVPPFTDATGMDLRSHVGATGLWLAWLVDGPDPLPPLHEGALDQAQVLPLVFAVDALAGASEDVRALAPLVRVQPARQGEWYDRVGGRVWTGWTGGDLGIGAEWVETEDDPAPPGVPAAAVWRAPSGDNAWLRVEQGHGAVRARVEMQDGVVRLSHDAPRSPLRLLLGGDASARVTADGIEHGGRTWRLEGVQAVEPEAEAMTSTAGAWRLVPSADGVALRTEV